MPSNLLISGPNAAPSYGFCLPAGLYQHLLRPHLPHLPHPSLGSAADLRHLPVLDSDGSRQIPWREGCQIRGAAPRLSPIQQPRQEERGAVVDLSAESDPQSWIRCFLSLYSVQDIRRLWLAQVTFRCGVKNVSMQLPAVANSYCLSFLSGQVVEMFAGAVSQHGRLLHQSPDREKDLHAVHGRVQCTLHFHVHLRNVLSYWEAHRQTGKDPPRERTDPICWSARTHQHGPTQIPVSQDWPNPDGQSAQFKQKGEGQRRYCDDHTVKLTGLCDMGRNAIGRS